MSGGGEESYREGERGGGKSWYTECKCLNKPAVQHYD